MLRQKTLLGETYVEITPGDPQSPAVPDGGKLPVGNIRPTVELDEIIQTFDPKTRSTRLCGSSRRGFPPCDGAGSLPTGSSSIRGWDFS